MGANYVWGGSLSGDWNTASNWLVAGNPASTPPGPSDTVSVISGGSTITITGAGSLQSASLSVTGPVDLSGAFYTGSFAAAGAVQIQGSLTDSGGATFTNGATLQGGVTSIQGQATFGSTFTLNGGELDLATAYPASVGTLVLVGATTLGGNWTATTLNAGASTSLTLGTGSLHIVNVPANLQSLIIAGNQALIGTFTATSLTVQNGASITLDLGDSLTAQTASFLPSGYINLDAGTLTVTGNASFGSNLTVSGAGSFTVGGTLSTNNGSITASGTSRVEINALDGTSGGLTLYSDATSTIEIGGQNIGTAGSITIDSGVTFTESGSFSAPVIVDNGTIVVAANTTLTLNSSSATRGLTGTGTVNINAGASLKLNGVDPGTSNQMTVGFAQPGGGLWLASQDFDALGLFKPKITGFASSDVIEYQGTATSVQYASGFLSLYNGGASPVAQFNIGSGYANAFSVVPIGGGYTQINYLGSGPKSAPAGTANPDTYRWVGPVAGFWNAAANWNDVTTGQNPAAVAPGTNDSVTIGAAANGTAQVIVGNGNASGLRLEGETLLDGVFKIGAGGLTVTSSASAYLYGGSSLSVAGDATFGGYGGATLDGGTMTVTGGLYGTYPSTFTIKNGGSLTAGQLVNYGSYYSVKSGGTLTAKGNVSDSPGGWGSYTVDAGTFTVTGTFVSSSDYVYAENGGKIQLASLAEDASGHGITLYADATSSIEVGSAGSVAAGSITIDTGKTVTEAGSFTATAIVDKGTLNVGMGQSLYTSGILEVDGSVSIGANGLLQQSGALTGAGKVTIGAGAKLVLLNGAGGSSAQIAYAGAGGQLSMDTTSLDASKLFLPTISGFGSTDVIDFTDYYATITAAHYAAGKINLYAGASVVATLSIGAGYSDAFSVVPLAGGYTYQINYLGGGTKSAPAGTASPDVYRWAGPVAAYWNAAANWNDVTAGLNPAAVAPGVNDTVFIGAAANSAAQVVIGNGNAYGLTLEGETLLDGIFKVGAGGFAATSSASAYLYDGSSLSVSGDATFGGYGGATLDGGKMTVTGTLNASYPSTFKIVNGGSLTAGQLVNYGGYYSVKSGGILTAKGNVSDSPGGWGSYTIDGGTFTVTATFVSSGDYVYSQDGGTIQLSSLVEDASGHGVTLYADATSSIEIGKTGGVAAGTITIDAGKTVTEAGSFSAPIIVDKGALRVGVGQSLYTSGTLQVDGSVTIGANGLLQQSGAVTGAGKVTISAGAKLSLLNGVGGSSVQIAYSGAGGQLALDTTSLDASKSFLPTITGFGTTDVIDFTDYYATITAAHYAAGKLNLYAGASVVATLNIGAGYNDAFSVVPLTTGQTYQINYLGGGTKSAPAGTASPDVYRWVGPVAGYWNATANWNDLTTGLNPAAVAPGVNDTVFIGAAANSAAQVVIGNGNAYGLTLEGETLLDGIFKVGAGGLTATSSASAYLYGGSSLSVSGDATFGGYGGATLDGGSFTVTGALRGSYPSTFKIENGGSLTAGQLVNYGSYYSVKTGGTLTAKGNVSDNPGGWGSYTVDGGVFTVTATFVSGGDYVYAQDGGTVQLSSLVEDASGHGVTLYADATSSIEIGKTGGVAAGTITIDAGKTVTEAGSFSAPIIVDKGALRVGVGQSLYTSGTLQVDGSVSIGANGLLQQSGAVTGAGKVTISAGAKLSLLNGAGGSSVQIAYSGAGGQLALDTTSLDASKSFLPTITGFGTTDVIDFTDYYATITAAHYAAGKLNLYAGASVVATLSIGAGYNDAFSVVPLTTGQTYQINYLGGGTKSAPAGTASPDSYLWVGAVVGYWNATANWDDVTTGKNPAAAAPGVNDTVTIGAAANGAAQVIVGNGNAYGLTLEGETLLNGVFKVVGTGANGGLTVTSSASAYLYGGSSLSVSGDATFGGYGGATLDGGAMTVTGTLYGNYPTSFLIESGGSLTAGQLVNYGSYYSVKTGGTLTAKGNVSDSLGGWASYTIDSGTFTVTGTFVSSNDYVYAQDGAKIQLASLAEDSGGRGVTLYADATSSIEIGTAGGVAAGTITIDAAKTVTEAGSFTAPTIDNEGTLAIAAGQTLSLYGALGGSGTVSMAAGSTLNLNGAAGAAQTIDLGGGSGALLDLLDPVHYAGSHLVGFGANDQVELAGAWSFVSFSENGGGTLGTLTLTDSTHQIGLNFAGDFTASDFIVSASGNTFITHS